MPGVWRFRVHVQPGAARNRVIGRYGDALKVQVQAAPVEGEANAAVVALLAQAFGVPRRTVHLRHGQSGRDKLVEMETTDPEACRRRLAELLEGVVDKPVVDD